MLDQKTKANALDREVNKLQALLKERFNNVQDYETLLKQLSDQVHAALAIYATVLYFHMILTDAGLLRDGRASMGTSGHGRGCGGDGV